MPKHDTVLWLVRHPEPVESARGRCYGALDVALSAHGERQAHSIAAAVAAERPAAIYTSPLLRCREAARIIACACGCRLETVDALREVNFGEFEGRSYDEIAADYPDLYRQWMEHPTETRFPGGEHFAEMADRVLRVARDLLARHHGEAIVLITHGGPIRLLLADALGMPPRNVFRIAQQYGAMNRIRYSGDVPTVELLNG